MRHRDSQTAQAIVALGVVLLIVGAWVPIAPVTAMALIALGATNLTLARFRGSPALPPIMLLHLATYGSLYALFLGATLHAATMRPVPSLGLLAAADLAASTWPMAIMIGRSCRALLTPFGQHG